MDKSVNEDDRQDHCGDGEDKNVEATTSKSVFNDPIQIAYNVNDLNALELNSADEVRQAMKELLKAKSKRQECEVIQDSSLKQQQTDLKHGNQNDLPDGGEKLIANVTEVDKDRETLETKNAKIRKRPGRPPKPGTSKKNRKTNKNTFYCGKLSQLIFHKQKQRYESSSDDDFIY